MAWLLKRKKKEPQQDPQVILEKIMNELDTITKAVEYLDKKAQIARDEAKKYANAKKPTAETKRKAKDFLKRSKQLEAQAARRRAIGDNLQNLQDQIVESISMGDIVGVMKAANDLMKEGIGGVKVDDIDELQIELGATMEDQERAFDALASPIGNSQIDDRVLEAELDELIGESDDADAEEVSAPAPARGHARPATAPLARDEEEMANLMAGFA
jgi:hypothetical protein